MLSGLERKYYWSKFLVYSLAIYLFPRFEFNVSQPYSFSFYFFLLIYDSSNITNVLPSKSKCTRRQKKWVICFSKAHWVSSICSWISLRMCGLIFSWRIRLMFIFGLEKYIWSASQFPRGKTGKLLWHQLFEWAWEGFLS